MSRWKQRGFTLAELTITMAVSGLLLVAILAGQNALRNGASATLAIDKVYNQIRDAQNSTQTAVNAIGDGNSDSYVYGTMVRFDHNDATHNHMIVSTLIADTDQNNTQLISCNEHQQVIESGMQYKNPDASAPDANDDAAIIYRKNPQKVFVAKGTIGPGGTYTLTQTGPGAIALMNKVTLNAGTCSGTAFAVNPTDPTTDNPGNTGGSGGGGAPPPPPPPPPPLPPPTLDTDSDGILDTADACKTVPDNTAGTVQHSPRNGCPVKWGQGLRAQFYNTIWGQSGYSPVATPPATVVPVDLHSGIAAGDYDDMYSSDEMNTTQNPNANLNGWLPYQYDGAVNLLRTWVGQPDASNTGIVYTGQIYVTAGTHTYCVSADNASTATIGTVSISTYTSFLRSMNCSTSTYATSGWYSFSQNYVNTTGIFNTAGYPYYGSPAAAGFYERTLSGSAYTYNSVPMSNYRHPEEATFMGNNGACPYAGSHCLTDGTSLYNNQAISSVCPPAGTVRQPTKEAMQFTRGGLTPGADYKMDLEYANHGNLIPPPNYKYHVCVYQSINGAPTSLGSVDLHSNTIVPGARSGEKLPFTVTIPNNGLLQLTFDWVNDYASGQYDANFMINQLEVYPNYTGITNFVAADSALGAAGTPHAGLAAAHTPVITSSIGSLVRAVGDYVARLLNHASAPATAAGSVNLLDRSSYESSALTTTQVLHFTDDNGHSGTVTVDPGANSVTRSFDN